MTYYRGSNPTGFILVSRRPRVPFSLVPGFSPDAVFIRKVRSNRVSVGVKKERSNEIF